MPVRLIWQGHSQLFSSQLYNLNYTRQSNISAVFLCISFAYNGIGEYSFCFKNQLRNEIKSFLGGKSLTAKLGELRSDCRRP